MGVPNVVYKYKSLKRLYFIIFVMNIAGIIIIIIIIISAIKLRFGISRYLDLVLPASDANLYFGILLLISLTCLAIYAFGTKLCFQLRLLFTPESNPIGLNKLLFYYSILCGVSTILIILSNTIGILKMMDDNRINKNGMIETMGKYSTEIMSKIQIDLIQINFKCCGSKSFKDWFDLRWIEKDQTSGINRDKEKNKTPILLYDVPFSCCANEMLEPCIHHDIFKPSEVYLYHPENRLTISTTGCHEKILDQARYIGGLFTLVLILLTFYQTMLGLLSRLLQTAHSNDFYIGYKKDRYVAWILGRIPSEETYNQFIYGSRKELEEEQRPLQRDSNMSIISFGVTKEQEKEKSLSFNSSSFENLTSLYKAEKKSSLASLRIGKSRSNFSGKSIIIPSPPPSPDDIDDEDKLNGLKESEIMKRNDNNRIIKKKKSISSEQLNKSKESLRSEKSSVIRLKNHKIGKKDSMEENETRIKKFCNDLSKEYKKSPYLKQRRDFSERYEYQDSRIPDYSRVEKTLQDSAGRLIRNDICSRFNPADTYSRFRGSVQDTMMRRSSQVIPAGPPPIPLPEPERRNNLKYHQNLRIHEIHRENNIRVNHETGNLPAAHYFPCNKIQIGIPYCKYKNKKPYWNNHEKNITTYFPVSSNNYHIRAPAKQSPGLSQPPPRLYGNINHRICHPVVNQNIELEDDNEFHSQGLYMENRIRYNNNDFEGNHQPPRFSGC